MYVVYSATSGLQWLEPWGLFGDRTSLNKVHAWIVLKHFDGLRSGKSTYMYDRYWQHLCSLRQTDSLWQTDNELSMM